MNVELHSKAIDLLKANFNIKVAINCRAFDLEPTRLVEKLTPFQDQIFSTKDKILLVHMDTDYYDPLLPYGTIPINVTRIFKNLNIPFHALLFVTNHFGIRKEFDALLKNQHPNDQPTVVETLLSPLLFPQSYKVMQSLSFNEIEKAGICMMRQQRSHRVAFYNFLLENNLLSKIAVSQHFNV